MEKFVVKIDKNSPEYQNRFQCKPYKRQTTIKSLKGVVVIEDIERAAEKLKNKETSINCLIEILVKLKTKNPSREVLKTTSIGKIVHKLCRHDNLRVSKLANEVYLNWKKHVIDVTSKKQVQVAFDQETQDVRKNAKNWLAISMNCKVGDEVVTDIEKIIFTLNKTLVGKQYKRNMRKMYLKLKGNDNLLKEIRKKNLIDLNNLISDMLGSSS